MKLKLQVCLLNLLLVTSGYPALAAPLSIPLKTWVARPIPEGKPCINGCKHIAVARNSDNGLLYLLGGDYAHEGFGEPSGRQEMWSYSIATNSWELLQPFCRTDGSPQPSGPDEVGWTYDKERKLVWMVPGFQWEHRACPSTKTVRGQVMTYDPASGQWSIPTVAAPRTFNGVWNVYDSPSETLIRFWGTSAEIYHVPTNTWESKNFPIKADFIDAPTTLDEKSRHVYLFSPVTSHLFRYAIDDRTMLDLGPAPTKVNNEDKPVWDPINNVLLWPKFLDTDATQGAAQERVHLHVYHPDTKTWETDIANPHPQSEQGATINVAVKGRHAIFDPEQNVLLVFGNVWNQPSSPYLFFFRYGNGGSGGPTLSSPQTPTDLTVAP